MHDIVIRAMVGAADLEAYVALRNDVTPDDPVSIEEIDWSDAAYPGAERFVAERGQRIVGAASVGRIFMYPADHPRLWASIVVAPDARRAGIGSRLLDAISRVAADRGKTGLQTMVRADRLDSIAFLAHRGFVEDGRDRMVRLDLAGLTRPEPHLPAGIVVTTLAERPDLLPAVHRVAIEAFPDIPHGDEPIDPASFDEFRARDVDRPGIAHDGFMIALDAATDEVVGYAALQLLPGSTTVAWHDMTAVRPAWRGRGIARALKLATIAWAMDRGLEALETGNDEDNAPMRAINQRLGYRPLPDAITMIGPLWHLPAAGPSG